MKYKQEINMNIGNEGMLEDRIIIIDGVIDDNLASTVIINMLRLFDENPKEKIYILINSVGGQITSAMAIHDVIKFLSCEIITIALKNSFSIATLLLTAGSNGKRYAFRNSEISLFLNLSAHEKAINEILEDSSDRVSLIIDKILNCFVETTGLSKEKLKLLCNMDNILSLENVMKCNLIDKRVNIDIPNKSKCRIHFIKNIKDESYYKEIVSKLQCSGIIS